MNPPEGGTGLTGPEAGEQVPVSTPAPVDDAPTNSQSSREATTDSNDNPGSHASSSAPGMAEAMQFLAETMAKAFSTMPAREREPDVEAPDYFRGKKNKCEAFIAGCRAVFEAQPKRYASDSAKVYYMGSRLKDSPRQWYDTYLVQEPEDRPSWFSSYKEFVTELRRVYGEKDPSAAARRELFGMRMQSDDAQPYIQRFQRLVNECGWDLDCEPLASSFYEGLITRFKNDLDMERDLRGESKHPTTTELMSRATELNKRYLAQAESARADEARANRSGNRNRKNDNNRSGVVD